MSSLMNTLSECLFCMREMDPLSSGMCNRSDGYNVVFVSE